MIVNTANSLLMYYLSMPYTANNIEISYIKRHKALSCQRQTIKGQAL